jgi:hypothetical protein
VAAVVAAAAAAAPEQLSCTQTVKHCMAAIPTE